MKPYMTKVFQNHSWDTMVIKTNYGKIHEYLEQKITIYYNNSYELQD